MVTNLQLRPPPPYGMSTDTQPWKDWFRELWGITNTLALAYSTLAIRTYGSVAALRGATGATGTQLVALLSSYYAGRSLGGGIFWYMPADVTSADNGITVIVDGSGRRWYRQNDGFLTPEMAGAYGDAVTDDAGAIESVSAFGTIVLFGPRSYRISRDVNKPVGTIWKGQSKSFTIVLSTTTVKKIIVTGQNATTFGDLFEDMQFLKVGIRYGNTNVDFGVGAVINRCLIQQADQGVYYKYNCYLTSIRECEIHHCTVDGVLYDMGGVTGSGSNLKISASNIYNNLNGVHYNGASVDGVDAYICDDTDIEHNGTDVLLTACDSTVTLHMTNVHMELSTVSNVTMDGGNVWLDHFWINLDGALPPVAHFTMTGGSLVISNGRFWDGIPIVKNTGLGQCIIDENTVIYGNLTLEQDAPAAVGDTAGYICRGPYQKLSAVPIVLVLGVGVEMLRIAQSETGNRVCRGRVTVVLGAAGGLIRLTVNPGGHNADCINILTAGALDFEVHMTRTGAVAIVTWKTSGAGVDYTQTFNLGYATPPGPGNTMYFFITIFNGIAAQVDYFSAESVPINTMFTT